MKKFGVLLIIIGLTFLIFLLFLCEFHFKADYVQTVKYEKITLGGEKSLFVVLGIIDKGEKIVISCKHFFVVGVLIFILGIYAIALHHDPKMKL